MATILERVKTSSGAGRTLDQVKGERRAKDWEASFPQSFVTSDHVVEEAYREAAPR